MAAHFVERCLREGHRVYGLDICNYAANENQIGEWHREYYGQFHFERGDIATFKYLPDCDIVANFAAETHVDNSIVASEDFIHTNVAGTRNILELIRAKKNYKAPSFIAISTDEVFGDCTSDVGFTEESPLNPSNPYSASKAAADMLITAWHRTYGTDYVILRPTNNYGNLQHPEKFIPKSIQRLSCGQKLFVHGDGSPTRYWLHASDTAAAVYDVMMSGVRNQIYNVSGDETISIRDVAHMIIDAYGRVTKTDVPSNKDDLIEYNFVRQGADLKYKIDDSKIRREIGWNPKIKIAEQIDGIVEHTMNHPRW